MSNRKYVLATIVISRDFCETDRHFLMDADESACVIDLLNAIVGNWWNVDAELATNHGGRKINQREGDHDDCWLDKYVEISESTYLECSALIPVVKM